MYYTKTNKVTRQSKKLRREEGFEKSGKQRIPSLPIPGQNHGKYVDHSLADKHLYSVCFMFSKKGEKTGS